MQIVCYQLQSLKYKQRCSKRGEKKWKIAVCKCNALSSRPWNQTNIPSMMGTNGQSLHTFVSVNKQSLGASLSQMLWCGSWRSDLLYAFRLSARLWSHSVRRVGYKGMDSAHTEHPKHHAPPCVSAVTLCLWLQTKLMVIQAGWGTVLTKGMFLWSCSLQECGW